MAVYQCTKCQGDEPVPRHYVFHLGDQCRCPNCGTFRVKKLKQRDKIDPMRKGVLNWMERLSGGHLFYCCFCRLQFYDRRSLAPRNELTTQPGTAKSGA
jgi:hypothetical protein